MLSTNQALFDAVQTGSVSTINECLQNGADVNCSNELGKPVLHFAVQSTRSTQVLQCLLDHGADVNIQDDKRATALHWAALWITSNGIQALLKKGANVNARDADQRTALHYASLFNRTANIKYLCSQGADIACVDAHGKTPLYILVDCYRSSIKPDEEIELAAEMIDYLLKRGANLFQVLKIQQYGVAKEISVYDHLPAELHACVLQKQIPNQVQNTSRVCAIM